MLVDITRKNHRYMPGIGGEGEGGKERVSAQLVPSIAINELLDWALKNDLSLEIEFNVFCFRLFF